MSNKKLLITGGTGSFGTTYLKGPFENFFSEILILVEMKKQDDLRKKLTQKK